MCLCIQLKHLYFQWIDLRTPDCVSCTVYYITTTYMQFINHYKYSIVEYLNVTIVLQNRYVINIFHAFTIFHIFLAILYLIYIHLVLYRNVVTHV